MKTLISLTLAALSLCAQPRATHVILSSKTSVTSDKVTVQQNQTTPALVSPISAVILSTVAGTVKIEHSGTAPTTTTSTPVVTIPGGPAAKAAGFSASNVGTGTTASVTYVMSANTPLVLDMTTMAFSGTGTTKNITVVIALGSTGDVQTALYFKED